MGDLPDSGVIQVRLLKPGSRFSLDVRDENGNIILEAHTPLSEGLLNHLKATGVERLSYDASLLKSSDGSPDLSPVISEDLRNDTYNHTKNILDEIRETFAVSPASGISGTIVDSSRKMVDKIISETEEKEDGIFDTVVKLKDMDDYYYQHSTNVGILSSILASRLDFKPEIKLAMGVGGLFHDIGFSSVSRDILYKAQLSDSEFELIKGHPHIGYKFVENNPHLQDIEKRALLLHHESADGRGYPFGFDLDHYRDNIPREIRLISLVDTYVTLTMPEPHKPSLTSRQALRSMVNMLFAPYKTKYRFLYSDLRDFIRGLGFMVNSGDYFMKPGDLVRISSGEVGIVQEMNRFYPFNPKVLVVKNHKMEKMKRPILIDMLQVFDGYIANLYDREKAAGAEEALRRVDKI